MHPLILIAYATIFKRAQDDYLFTLSIAPVNPPQPIQ